MLRRERRGGMVRGVMSQKSHHDIACPFCGAELCVELYDSVIVDEDPGLRTDLFTGKLNRVTCDKCGKSFRVDQPLVYHDREQEIFIHYHPLVGGATMESAVEAFNRAMAELRRLVPSGMRLPETHLVLEWSELVERVFLLEEGLDARVVEHVKYMMFQQNPGKLDASAKGLLFDAQDSTDEQLCFVVQDRASRRLEAMLHFARKDYEALLNVFGSGQGLKLLMDQFPGPVVNGRLKVLQDRLLEKDEEPEEEKKP